MIHISLIASILQDQTARASEARVLELEVARQKDEVAALKQQLAETQTLEKDKRKLSDKVEKLETRVRIDCSGQTDRLG